MLPAVIYALFFGDSLLLPLLVIMVLAVGTATAQNVNIGVKGGLNSFNIETDNNSGFDSKIG